MTFDIFLIINLIVLLYVWFDSDAIIEWASVLRLKWFKYNEYRLHKQSPVPMLAAHMYPEFLAYHYGEKYFLIRLITCPVCLTVWLNVALMCVFPNEVRLIWFGANVILSLLGYHSLRWILKVFNTYA